MTRGIALLMALLCLSLLSLTGVGILRAATHASLGTTLDAQDAEDRMIVEDLCRILLIHTRVAEGTDTRLLKPGLTTWLDGVLGDETAIRVQALDLCGLLRADQLHTFAASGLPASTRLDRTQAAPITAGLPRPLLDAVFQDPNGLPLSPRLSVADESIWRWVTTHGSGALNLHTAPSSLLQAALIGAEPTSASQVIAARVSGKPLNPSLAQRLIAERTSLRGQGRHQNRYVALTDRSEAMAFVITIERPNGMRRRWWVVSAYVPDEHQPAWRIIERRRIPS